MKTFPSDLEYNDIGTQIEAIPEERGERPRCPEEKSYTSNGNDNSSESENLIICNSGLASSFQTLKSEKYKLSPGHYLHRVFLSSVAKKFRSQSLPNCSDKRKHNNGSNEGTCEDLIETSVPLVESINLDPRHFNSSDTKDCITEGWFKTWPERGIDKIISVGRDSQCETDKSDRAEGETIDAKDFHDFTSNHVKVDFSDDKLKIDKIDNSAQTFYRPKSNPNKSKDQTCFKENFGDSVILTGRVGKTDLRDALSEKNQTNNNPVRLDELLDSFPLAYSPVTKQLLLIKADEKHSRDTSHNVFSKSNSCDEVLNLEGVGSETDLTGGAKECLGDPKGLECDVNVESLHRISTEVSSFSSTVSSLSDISPSVIEDSALGSLLDHGDTCSLVSVGGCSAFSEDSVGGENKKKSLSGFFSRNVFNWKSSCRSEDSVGRWKLFGKNTSPPSSHGSLTVDHYVESDGGSLAPDSPSSVRSGGSTARLETRVASSSALIQLDRPANLPAKSEQEQARHRAQYKQMLDAAKKKELKEAKLRKKQLQMQLKVEEQLAQDIRTWTHEILPRWDQMHGSRKAQELWWQGVPPCVRGKVWRLAIGNPLNLTHSLYNVYVQRAQDRLRGGSVSEDDKEASVELIRLDISRTFPHLCIFQHGGPYYDMLHCLLAAYVCYRPDLGYVQGMSFIAAVLILNMEAADAFVCFANLLDRPCHRAFFHLSQPHMQAYYSTYDWLFRENLPELHAHFTSTTLTPDLYLLDWIYTVFTKTMNLDLACRVWDVFLRDGEHFLFRTALGVLHLCQDALLQMDFVRGSQFLTRLPDDLPGDQLFKSISCIRMTVGKQSFQDILALHSAGLDIH